MKNIGRIVGRLLVVVLLTVICQVGGLTYLLGRVINRRWIKRGPYLFFKRLGLQVSLYLLVTVLVVPVLAPINGRRALPVFSQDGLVPHSYLTCLLNRHYVTENMFDACQKWQDELRKNNRDASLFYLDANFPFIDGFPLLPHWSHSDGRKLDFTLYFKSEGSEEGFQGKTPTHLGYGSAVKAEPHEENTVSSCRSQGYYQYDLLERATRWTRDKDLVFDQESTRTLVEILLESPEVEKVFLEPHLVTRMNLGHPKMRFHGCHAVAHDDHIHVQIVK